ncbi:PD40 domain-containing protein [Labilibacter marinus]|uniref:PD40 domain-containing protein n=1 Tax=Labilibacter marinus TaxID=1477105 RepID=UPI00094F7E9A|nr:PD40 domain-containing protein [Labilibacter marinus]
MKKFKLHILLIEIIISILILSCSGGKKVSQAQKAFEIGEYNKAAALYKKAYSGEKNKYNKGEYAYFMGECYRITNLPTKASSAYSKAVRYNYPIREARLYMAESYRKAGKLEKAIPEYEAYLEEVPADIRAQKGLASCMMLQKGPKENRYIVEKIKKLSSKHSDYSPAYAGKEYDYVVFSSMRTEAKQRRKNRITGQGVSTIYYSKIDSKGEWTDPEAFDEPINNKAFDDGAPNVSADNKTLYYTRCRFDNEKPMGSEIVFCSRSGGKWSEPTAISIGDDSLVVAHPAIHPDGEILYFVSDREGGFGGKDIWKTKKMGDGKWGEPSNMGSAINTKGDEMFPYVRENGIFYFSSDTHVGYGGLDIFKAVPDEEKEWIVSNMGAPLNSNGDDFGMTFKGKQEEGLFSSSRGSSKGIDNIYSFLLPKLHFTLNGSIKNVNDEFVEGAYLRLIGSDGTTMKINAPTDGSFKVKLKPETDYVFLVAAQGYLNEKVKFSTSGEVDDKDYGFDVILKKPKVKIEN